MKKLVMICLFIVIPGLAFSQSNWATQYVTLDVSGEPNALGSQTSSVAVLGANNFVALITEGSDLFAPPANYLFGFSDGDSTKGAVTSAPYGTGNGKFTKWTDGFLDEILLEGAWQIAGGSNNYVYVANNDMNHNILVFELKPDTLESTPFRMETGTENIWAIEVDTSGYVYVCDREGRADKTNEIKVYAPIGAPGTTWEGFGGHTDAPVATIDLPEGLYQGITVSGDGTQVFVSSTSTKSLLKFTGDPNTGYTQDTDFSFTLAADDTLGTQGIFLGRPSLLGLAYDNVSETVFAVADSFRYGGSIGGYVYGRIYLIDGNTAANIDTIDIAQWNFNYNGSFTDASGNGRSGGFTSVMDVDFDETESAVYTQTYFGWAVEKWVSTTPVSVARLTDNLPESFSLQQNYPNPFNPSTTIAFELKTSENVTLNIYNILGQKIATVLNERLNPGSYKATFDATKFPTGIYFYTLKAGSFKETRKMTLLK